MDIVILLLIGGLAGTLAGLLGIGGGAIIVPALVFWFEHRGVNPDVIMQSAIGTSLATIVFTAISSIRAHHAHGAINWGAFRQLTPGVLLGALAGAAIAHMLPGKVLRTMFGVFLWFVALQLVWRINAGRDRALPNRGVMFTAGGVIGTLSALFGIGGGTISVPFLTWHGLTIQQAIATAAAVGLPIAVAGTIGYVVTGWGASGLPSWSFGYVVLLPLAVLVATSVVCAPLGARWAHRLPQATLRRVFAVLLGLLGLRLLTT